MMQSISVHGSAKHFLESMKPIDYLDFSRGLNECYPIKEKIRKPNTKKKVYTSVNSIVLGQFIMLEQIITGKTKLPDHLVDLEIAKLVIRPEEHDSFDNEDIEAEKKNQEDILNMDVREVYWILENFMNDRNKTLFKDFSGVFYDAMEEDDEEEEIVEDKTAEMLFNQQWYWYSMVRMLANEDITKYSDIYMLPMSVVLPEMSFLAQRSKIENARKRQEQATRKL
jgi:hypothetical protein